MSWDLVELCCGSAALSLHFLGARRALVPYQGSKWRFRKAIAELAREPSAGPLERVGLFDPGPWGTAAASVLDARRRAGVIEALEALDREDPRRVFDRLHGRPVPADDVGFAAEYLFLQRLAYSGKAVGVRDGRWASPGFNTSSAFGLPGTDRFGEVLPMIPSLIAVLRGYSELRPVAVVGERTSAPLPPARLDRRTVAYLDPPYAGSTTYPNGSLDRSQVVALALAWAEAGASVIVSEGVPVAELVDRGWTSVRIYEGRKDASPFRGKQEEWVTVHHPP